MKFEGMKLESLFVLAVVLVSVCDGSSEANKIKQPQTRGPVESAAARLQKREQEYEKLYSTEVDKRGLESIRELHMQLDDDKDGSIEPSETGDFIRADLKSSDSSQRQKKFHRKDSEITVNDLWHTWRKSEVHNWTVSQTIEWLSLNVELPQYAENFKRHGVNGSKLPQVAVSSQYLGKVVGIENPIHRSKITLKAMDVVLFGPPKDSSNFFKDVLLSSLLVLTATLLFYAYRQDSKSKEHLKKMLVDMDGLAKAEKELKELQSKLQQRDSEMELSVQLPPEVPDKNEVSRLREEVEVLRNELQRAEVELEDRFWEAPLVLQHWLQLTYEIENASYNSKRKAAEEQLEMAKDMCEKLNKKRSSFVGAFVSTHGRSIDDVDKSILEAKNALNEVTKDLAERSQRWRQIEMLCNCTITTNPGISVLNNLVRHVGAGRVGQTRPALSSRMSNRGSQDDLLLLDDDSHSVAASSTHMTSSVSGAARTLMSSAASVAGAPTAAQRIAVHKVVAAQMSRESSKESSSADDLLELKSPNDGSPGAPRNIKGPRIGPGGRRMVKSFSQDASTSMSTNAAVAISNLLAAEVSIPSSVSDSQLGPKPTDVKHSPLTKAKPLASTEHNESASSINRQLNVPDCIDGSCSDTASISSSTTDLSVMDKKKKRRSFFNFRRSKRDQKKAEVIL